MFDYKNPDYGAIYRQRALRLDALLKDSEKFKIAVNHYRYAPWDFIADWGITYDPRNADLGLPTHFPFVLWGKQTEYLQWIYHKWRKRERGLVEKSRDCGVSWLSTSFAATMWIFEPGFSSGFGSFKEEKVDQKGQPDSLFEKIRIFIDNLPVIFLPQAFSEREHSSFMRIINPENGNTISGEVGDNVGRGGRKSIYFVDEAAFIEHQEEADRSLSQTTNCQIDISTPNGNGNAFYKKRLKFDKTGKLFIFDWRDDPRKDAAWYQKQKDEQDEVTVAQEIDRDYNASQEDAFIPAKWVVAAIDAHKRLGIRPSGIRTTGFDPADTGDAKAAVNRHGSVILEADQKHDGDITQAIPWAFEMADAFRADVFGYDGDGMGAPSMKLALIGMAARRMKIVAYHGSAAVVDPDKKYGSENLNDHDLKTNDEQFRNFRAQSATWLRDRFKATYDAIERAKLGHVVNFDPDKLISIDSACKCLVQLQSELSRPKRIFTDNGKILVESKKQMKARGVDSPNLFDATVIAFAMKIPEQPQQTIKIPAFTPADPGMNY